MAENTTARVHDLCQLHTGDEIEARDLNMVRHRGVVDATAPGLGIVWIREAFGGRKILHSDEFTFWQVRSAA